jgi:hypothetical protein
MDSAIRLIADTIQPSRGMAWHGGPTPAGALRNVAVDVARWRPGPDRHTLWELALHIAYWNYAVRRRLLGHKGPRFPRSPANWPAMPRVRDEAAWVADRALVSDQQRQLVETIRAFPGAKLGRSVGSGKRWSWGDLLIGIAMHDAYHAGQIQLMKRLWRSR